MLDRLRHQRIVPLLLGVALLLGGLTVVGVGVYSRVTSVQQANQRSGNDSTALNAWKSGGASALTGAASATSTGGTGCGGSVPSADAYALLSFTSLSQYGYAGVAVDGNWDNLHDRSMVHWHGSADPGGQGNAIIAFHREPNYEHMDQLGVGGLVTIQDRKCHQYVYKVTQTWNIPPEKVTQLVPTSGHDLTLITCTPWWQDYNRLVWRATLVSVDGKPFTA